MTTRARSTTPCRGRSSMFDALPIHTTSLHLVVEEIAGRFEGTIKEGDVFMCNDPYRDNTHVGDLVTAAPVFADGRAGLLVGHQGPPARHRRVRGLERDGLGRRTCGRRGSRSRREGSSSAGEMRQDVLDLYLANVRYRDLLRGRPAGPARLDRASGRQRLDRAVRRVRRREVLALRRRDHRLRRPPDGQEIAAMPDGTYTGRGLDRQRRLRRRAHPGQGRRHDRGRPGDGRLHGQRRRRRGAASTARSPRRMAAGAIPFLYYIDPDIPHNHGCIEHIEVIAPEGTICNASYPAST